jgi:hypothetical protein
VLVVDPGQVDPFLQDLLPDVLGSVDGGEDAIELLAFMAREEAVGLAEGRADLVEGLLAEVTLDLTSTTKTPS